MNETGCYLLWSDFQDELTRTFSAGHSPDAIGVGIFQDIRLD